MRRLLRWGIDFIQVREKALEDRELLRLTTKIVHLARGTPCRVLVNGRADIALAAGAAGVHLPSTGLRVRDVHTWVPPGFLVGCSTHSGEEARRAQVEGADYLLLGPVFETPSKAHLGSPLGLPGFAEICRGLEVPVLALGGICRESVPSVLESGAAGVAAIRLFQSAREFDAREARVLHPPRLRRDEKAGRHRV